MYLDNFDSIQSLNIASLNLLCWYTRYKIVLNEQLLLFTFVLKNKQMQYALRTCQTNAPSPPPPLVLGIGGD